MAASYPIQADRLRKTFGERVAVADLTLTVERGEVFAFLGPNGAGKTTSVKMLLGLITPTSGDGRLRGWPLGDPRGRARVGFLPEHFRFHDWLRAVEFLQLHADLYGMPRDVARRRIPELLDLAGLGEHANSKLHTFSKGMLQRIGLAQALLNEPEIVFLDEPTSGLDPIGRRQVRDVIRELRSRGTTVFLNSHLLSEVEVTCDRVAFMSHGEILRIGTLRSLLDGELTVEIRARPRGSGEAVDAQWQAVVAGLKRWSNHVRVRDEHISLVLPNEADLPAITRYLTAHDVDVYALSPQRVSLEDVFMRLVGEGEPS